MRIFSDRGRRDDFDVATINLQFIKQRRVTLKTFIKLYLSNPGTRKKNQTYFAFIKIKIHYTL